MNRWLLLLTLLPALSACQLLQRTSAPRAAGASVHVPSKVTGALLEGVFDNHEQVWSAREKTGAIVPPHVVVTIEATAQPEWSIWHIHLDATPPLDATWAMHRSSAAGATASLVPHRAIDAAISLSGAPFDPKQWIALDACALQGPIALDGFNVAADVAACTSVIPGLGPQAALLPLAVEREGEWLHTRLFADQARGGDARVDLRKAVFFAGWAAINGAGPNAPANNDWHISRTLKLGDEGGRAALTWRDGKPSGYSLTLERLTYRDGNVPVLKLSVVDDASGKSLAYVWANPEALRIGLNLGWAQVGLERAADVGANGEAAR